MILYQVIFPGNKIVQKNVIIRLNCFYVKNIFGHMQPPVVKHVKYQAQKLIQVTKNTFSKK